MLALLSGGVAVPALTGGEAWASSDLTSRLMPSFYAGLLRWTDGVSLVLAVVMILVLIAWWP